MLICDHTLSVICDVKKNSYLNHVFFLYPTLAKINALNLETSLSEGGLSSRDHCFVAFLAGPIDLINCNFRFDSPNGKQIGAAATYCFSRAASFKQAPLDSNPPAPAERRRETAALRLRSRAEHSGAGHQAPGRLSGAAGHQSKVWGRRVPSACERRRSGAAAPQHPHPGTRALAPTSWHPRPGTRTPAPAPRHPRPSTRTPAPARRHPRPGTCTPARRHPHPSTAPARCRESLASPSGRRKITTDGNWQQGTNSKTRGIHDRNCGEKEKKAIPMYSFHLFS